MNQRGQERNRWSNREKVWKKGKRNKKVSDGFPFQGGRNAENT